VLNVFFRNPGAPLAPGTIVEIYGTALAGGLVNAALENGRLPLDVNNVSILIGGLRAPLYSLSPGQINAQIPYELTAGDQHLLIVRSNRAYSVPAPIALAERQPGLAVLPDGTAIAVDPAFQLITPSNPARRGGFITLYLVGLGATQPSVPSGAVAPAEPLARVVDIPVVMLGGRQATVLFAGLTPGFAGLYQLNIQAPADVQPGTLELFVIQRGAESNRATLPVE
jgi:uncharacterized protein (TIGR03437 family)